MYKQVVEEKAARTPGKKSLAIEAYARALRAIPGTICDNAGEPSCVNVLCEQQFDHLTLLAFKHKEVDQLCSMLQRNSQVLGQTCAASGHTFEIISCPPCQNF